MMTKEKLKYFKDREELKWHFHKQLCKGDSFAEFKMNRVVDEEELETMKDVNDWLKQIGSNCRVREE